MTLLDSIENCLTKTFQYSGRASRSEFWWFFLFVLFARLALGAFKHIVLMTSQGLGTALELVVTMISLILILPTVAVQVRRLHDVGHSGWWVGLLWCLLTILFVLSLFWNASIRSTGSGDPYQSSIMVIALATAVVWVWVFFLTIKRGDAGPNRYGNPTV